MTSAQTRRLGYDDRLSRLVAIAVDRLAQDIPALRPLQQHLGQITRYIGVGVTSSLIYAVAVAVATTGLHISPAVSSLLGYAFAVPFNFVLHRHFTFRSNDDARRDLVRYAFAQAVGITISYACMALSVDAFGLPYGVGILGGIILVPVVNYLMMDRWVFATRAAR